MNGNPYNYSFNNPIRYNDPNGDCPPGVDCNNPLPEMQVHQNRGSNLGPGNVRNNGTRPHRGHDLWVLFLAVNFVEIFIQSLGDSSI
jgi:hypothetical protein